MPKRKEPCGATGTCDFDPNANAYSIDMNITCTRLTNGTCPQSARLPRVRTYKTQFPMTRLFVVNQLRREIDGETADCPEGQNTRFRRP